MPTAEQAHRREVYLVARRAGLPQVEAAKLAGVPRTTSWRLDRKYGLVSSDGPVQQGRVRWKPAPIPGERPPVEPVGLPAGRTLGDVALDHALEDDRRRTAVTQDPPWATEREDPTEFSDLAVQSRAEESLRLIARPQQPEEPRSPTEELLGERLEEQERHPAGQIESLPRGRYAFGIRMDRYGRPAPPPTPGESPEALRPTDRGPRVMNLKWSAAQGRRPSQWEPFEASIG
jgi:hypothetical protein